MDFINILLVSVIVVNLMLVIISSAPKKVEIDVTHKIFLFNILTIVFWIGSMVLNRVSTLEVVVFTTKMLYMSATFIASSFYLFVIFFVHSYKTTDKEVFVVFLSNLMIAVLVWSEKIIKNVQINTGEISIQFGTLYIVYIIYILFCFLRSFEILFFSYKKETVALKKGQIFYIFVGYTFSGVISLFADLFWPILKSSNLCWLGPVSTICVSLATFYAIKRYKLFGAKVFVAELLVFVLWIFSIPRAIAHSEGVNLMGDIFSVALTLVLGIFLIDVAKKESIRNDENKTLIKQLDLANQELKKINDIKNRFMSLSTHHIASPLTTLKLYHDFFKESGDEIKQKDIFLDIGVILEKLVSAVKDFIDVSKIENNIVSFDFKNHYPEDIIDSLLTLKNKEIGRKKIKVSFLRNKTPICLKIDKDKFTTAVDNIIDNIIKFSENREFCISCSSADNYFCLKISDCVRRTLPKTPDILLSKFSDKEDYFEADIISNCLGLYVSRQIINAHKGILSLYPKADFSGCVFDIKIPIREG